MKAESKSDGLHKLIRYLQRTANRDRHQRVLSSYFSLTTEAPTSLCKICNLSRTPFYSFRILFTCPPFCCIVPPVPRAYESPVESLVESLMEYSVPWIEYDNLKVPNSITTLLVENFQAAELAQSLSRVSPVLFFSLSGNPRCDIHTEQRDCTEYRCPRLRVDP
jgi:hypothetical protein